MNEFMVFIEDIEGNVSIKMLRIDFDDYEDAISEGNCTRESVVSDEAWQLATDDGKTVVTVVDVEAMPSFY